jgi:hypothetical protein
VFENRIFRRIFGMKRNKAMEGWRLLHSVLHNLCGLFNDAVGI